MTHAFLSQLENDGRIKCVFSTRRQFCGEKFSWIKSVFLMHQRHVTTSAYWIKRWTPVYTQTQCEDGARDVRVL